MSPYSESISPIETCRIANGGISISNDPSLVLTVSRSASAASVPSASASSSRVQEKLAARLLSLKRGPAGATVRLFAERGGVIREISLQVPKPVSGGGGAGVDPVIDPALPAAVQGKAFGYLVTRKAVYDFLNGLPAEARLQMVQAKVTVATTDSTVTLTWDRKTRRVSGQAGAGRRVVVALQRAALRHRQRSAAMAGEHQLQDRPRAHHPMNSPPTATALHDFGQVAEHGDSFELFVDRAAGATCRMVAVVQTERGPKRTLLAEIPGALWRRIGPRAVRELAQGMGEDERGRAKAPTLKTGGNRLSPLLGRELTLLLWTLQEDGAEAELEAILQGWRELAREERWWLFSKASAPGQRTGLGWRRALFLKLRQLRAEFALGLADLDRGAYTDYDADDLPKLAERIKAVGRERLAGE